MSNEDREYACLTARTKIEKLAKKVADEKTIIPEYLLKEFLDKEQVQKILRCDCTSCSKDAKILRGINSPDEYIDKIIQDAICLLALLTKVKHPRLINSVLAKRENFEDRSFPEWLMGKEQSQLATELWPEFQEHSRKQSKDASGDLGVKFLKELPSYFVPKLSLPTYVEWNSRVILPFYDEELIKHYDSGGATVGGGANSEVYKFKIVQGYLKLKGHTDDREYARKEINLNSKLDLIDAAQREKEALKTVGYLEHHKHIVRMIKTYKHGNKFNIIFPCAMTNLDRYLRDPKYNAPKSGGDRPCDLWSQMLGITQALAAVHGHETEHIVHADIKPANILVEKDGTWVISDFGQTSSKKISPDTTSRVSNRGGTESYAPPEIRDEKLSKKYDIWSLGCILLELISFILSQYDGLTGGTGLDIVRKTKLSHLRREEDYCFYEESTLGSGSERKYMLKGTVQQFLEDLTKKAEKASVSDVDRRISKQMIKMVLRMLSIQVDDRPHAREVALQLEHEINLVSTILARDDTPREDVKDTPWNSVLSKFASQGLYLWDDNTWRAARVTAVRLTMGGEHYINLDHTYNTSPTHTLTIRRELSSSSFLVPWFAFQHVNGRILKHHAGIDDPAPSIILSTISEGHYKENLIYNFNKNDNDTCREFQSLFTGHIINKSSFEVTSFDYTPKTKHARAILHEMVKMWRKPKSTDQNTEPQHWTPLVELWTESSRVLGTSAASNEDSTAVRPRRVVVYGVNDGHSIAILKIDKHWRLEKDTGKKKDARDFRLRFVPVDPSSNDRFSVLIIGRPNSGHDDNNCAGIPIDIRVLHKLEGPPGASSSDCNYATAVDCASVTMNFNDKRSRDDFKNDYKVLKENWQKERHAEEVKARPRKG
ncbi:kinase-like protein [Saccharata proteae CBS 121410]|uniref:non-specific serine/threonine protein kinase n=1 Tax=Saccharata proteae CBS 121410 TaxID=1314787 RepID=A0A9P4HY00_9PEZI|nr:kinase-like protein [Saccharata proteae CBS 121410]